MSYHTPDKLLLKYGTEKTVAVKGGEYRTNGRLHELELKINLADLTVAEVIQSDVDVLPVGARIQDVIVVANTAAATGVAIDLGLTKASDRSTEVDFDGILAAYPLASMDAAGENSTVTIGTSFVGALIGTTLAFPSYISASRTTATAFTAGQIVVTIRYFVP